MRLGDLDALKEDFADMRDGYPNFSDTEMLSTKDIAKIIDNAPTVDCIEFNRAKKLIKQAYQKGKDIRQAIDCKDCDGYEAGYSAGLKDAERPQDEFTDLERKVIADSINYLLGAELLEENGYREEVINALKSVLQKIGAEENHL